MRYELTDFEWTAIKPFLPNISVLLPRDQLGEPWASSTRGIPMSKDDIEEVDVSALTPEELEALLGPPCFIVPKGGLQPGTDAATLLSSLERQSSSLERFQLNPDHSLRRRSSWRIPAG